MPQQVYRDVGWVANRVNQDTLVSVGLASSQVGSTGRVSALGGLLVGKLIQN